MSHQVSELLTDKSIAPSFKTTRRLPFNLQASDLKMAASSSMIVCSAMLINHTSQAAIPKTSTQPCESPSNVSERCSPAPQPTTSASPEPASRGEWSGRPFEQLQSQQNKLPRKMEAMYADLLNQSQAAASRDQLTEAIQTIAGIPTNSQHHELAQQLQEDWSRELVRQATNRFQQGEVAPAIALLKSIPITSQWHDRAIELRQRWDQQAKLLNQATAATAAADWQGAIDAIKSLEGLPLHNSLPVQELLQQAMAKRYEPESALLQIAIADSPMMSAVAPPETIAVSFK
ncbi:MAG: hypothetical protein HC780_28965 [Leptolyngbyaceae cyanobacterium CSU_1_3]|nr:hypothetical protein [Leptolyngbyaceae cyanobacterium CSU_1_3]